jgi:hypothetical protein
MNRINYFSTLSICLFLLGISCKSDNKSGDQAANGIDTTAILEDTSIPQPVLPPPPVNKEVEKIIDEQWEKSEFKNIGCCKNKQELKSENCCCPGILEKYKKMTLLDQGKMKAKDPIFNECLKKKDFRLEVEKIDDENSKEEDLIYQPSSRKTTEGQLAAITS